MIAKCGRMSTRDVQRDGCDVVGVPVAAFGFAKFPAEIADEFGSRDVAMLFKPCGEGAFG